VCGKLVGDVVIAALIDYFTSSGNEEVRAVKISFDDEGFLQITPSTDAATT
jgi:hypothetical protein